MFGISVQNVKSTSALFFVFLVFLSTSVLYWLNVGWNTLAASLLSINYDIIGVSCWPATEAEMLSGLLLLLLLLLLSLLLLSLSLLLFLKSQDATVYVLLRNCT